MDARPEFDSDETGAAEPRRRSIVETWTEVVADAGGLVRAEAALARAETERNIRLIGRESAKILVGGMLALMALVFLTIAAVVALAEFIGLLPALLVVAGFSLGAGWLLISRGLEGVSGQSILPERVLKRMGRDLDRLADRAPLPGAEVRPDESGGVREAA